jgi:hypothetical protein
VDIADRVDPHTFWKPGNSSWHQRVRFMMGHISPPTCSSRKAQPTP